MINLSNFLPDNFYSPAAGMGAFDDYFASIQPSGAYEPAINTPTPQDPFAAISGTEPGDPWMGGDQPFTFPGQEYFDLLADQLQNWMGGMVQEPSAWGQAIGFLTPMARTGMPVDVSGLYGAMEPVAQRYLEETGAGLAEQFGLGGLRFSTPLQAELVRETERMGENMALAQVKAEIAAQEAAKARIIQAAMGIGNIGGMQGQFGLGGAGLQQGAANALFNLANTQALMPLTIGQGMMGMQGMMEAFQNQALQGSQMNPWLPFAMQMFGQGGYAPTGPSPYEQLMNIGGDWLSYFMTRNQGPQLGNTPLPPAAGYNPNQMPFYDPTQVPFSF